MIGSILASVETTQTSLDYGRLLEVLCEFSWLLPASGAPRQVPLDAGELKKRLFSKTGAPRIHEIPTWIRLHVHPKP